jgi:hypothetical protein
MFMFGIDIRIILNTLFILCALFALWKGGPAERATAIVVILNVLVGLLGTLFGGASEGLIRLVNDGLTALVLLGVTLRYGALWMGGVMLFFAAQFAMHSYYLVTERPNDYWHALINNVDFSGIIWCLIVGTLVAWRARARRAKAVAET